ncbi:hypothetical protein [Streptomyces sp. NPDC017435]
MTASFHVLTAGYADDRVASSERVLALGPAVIVPGHGEPFVPGPSTPL